MGSHKFPPAITLLCLFSWVSIDFCLPQWIAMCFLRFSLVLICHNSFLIFSGVFIGFCVAIVGASFFGDLPFPNTCECWFFFWFVYVLVGRQIIMRKMRRTQHFLKIFDCRTQLQKELLSQTSRLFCFDVRFRFSSCVCLFFARWFERSFVFSFDFPIFSTFRRLQKSCVSEFSFFNLEVPRGSWNVPMVYP